MAQFVDLIVDGGILLDVGIRLRNVCLRLIVVIVADKVADVVVGEKGFELARKLRGERLVVRDDEGRPLHALDDLCHRICLARSRRTEENLRGHPVLNTAREVCDCLRLIAHRRKGCSDLERSLPRKTLRIEFRNHRHHFPSSSTQSFLYYNAFTLQWK